MSYTKEEQLEIAIKIAVNSHFGQKDKCGRPYIFHPFTVMDSFNDYGLKIIAVLHDVIEDTDITANDFLVAGIDIKYIDSVLAISQKPEESYFNYIKKCKKDFLAKCVKIADLEHNMSSERMRYLPEKEQISLMKRYQKAKDILTNKIPG